MNFLENSVNSPRVYDIRNVRTLRELLEGSVQLYANNIAFTYLDAAHKIVEKTYSETFSDVMAFSAYLNSRSLGGKHIGVIGHNCYEWALTYLTVTCGVGVIVPIDKELKAPDVANIIDVAEVDALVYMPEEEDIVSECREILKNPPEMLNASLIRDYIIEGNRLIDGGDTSYSDYKIDPFAMSILLFTSGTTGMAKGVMLSQNNICADIIAVRKRLHVTPDDRAFSVLPLHHTYECTAGFLTPLYCGASISYCESLRRIMTDVVIFKPTVMIAVPLLLENIHANVVKKIKKSRFGNLKLAVGHGAARISPALGKMAFKQIQQAFGGRIRLIITGAASLDPVIYRDLSDFGFTIYNGYGLTETSPVCIMHNDFVKLNGDNIGIPVAGVEVKLVAYSGANEGQDVKVGEVGEIAVKGEPIMLGYYKNPNETARVMRDGWFYTGDLATVDSNGYYKIVGRIKNMIVTKNGKKIFPEEMEYLLEKNVYIKESVVYGSESGDGDYAVSAKIYPDYDVVNGYLLDKKLCSKEQIDSFGIEYVEQLKFLFKGVVKEINRNVPGYKMLRMFRIRRTEFIKTTTKKIKRNAEDCDSDYLI